MTMELDTTVRLGDTVRLRIPRPDEPRDVSVRDRYENRDRARRQDLLNREYPAKKDRYERLHNKEGRVVELSPSEAVVTIFDGTETVRVTVAKDEIGAKVLPRMP